MGWKEKGRLFVVFLPIFLILLVILPLENIFLKSLVDDKPANWSAIPAILLAAPLALLFVIEISARSTAWSPRILMLYPDKLVWRYYRQNHRLPWDAVEAFEFADIGAEDKFKKVAVRFRLREKLQRRVLVIPDAATMEALSSALKTKN